MVLAELNNVLLWLVAQDTGQQTDEESNVAIIIASIVLVVAVLAVLFWLVNRR